MSTPDHTAPSPRRRLPLLAAALALIIGAVAVLVLLPHRNTPTTSPSSSPDPTVRLTTPAPISPASDTPLLTAAPTGITWKLVGQVPVPFSDTAGPRRVSGGTASGYAHSPVGALLAAAQINIRAGYSAGLDSWEPTLRQQFVPSPDRDALLQLLRQAKSEGQPVAAPGELAHIAGFRFHSYTPQAATLALVLRSPTGTYAVLTLTVQWADGDWKMLAPPAGHWPAITTQPTDLTGVIPWGAG